MRWLSAKDSCPLKMETQAGAYQMLPQIATLIGIDLGARIIEVVVFDKGAELRSPIVVCACDDLPGEVRMTSPSTVAEASMRAGEVEPGRFGIVNADACADVCLKPSKCESPDEVPHERASVDKGSRTGLPEYVSVCKPHGRISATSEAIVKKVAFNGGTKYACSKDVAEFDTTEETDIIFWADTKSISKVVRKSSISAAVLIDICSHVDGSVKAEPIKFRLWRRRDIL